MEINTQYGSLREKIAAESAERKARYATYERAFSEAHEAGMAAGRAITPRPMIVGSPSTPLGNDVDPSQPTYFVEDGVCGFAWVKVRDRKFANWLKKAGKVRGKAYSGGVDIWVSEFGQNMQRKEAYAQAFAAQLHKLGIAQAYADSRMD